MKAPYIIPTEAVSFSGLSHDKQTKVFAIYELARVIHNYGKTPITSDEFDSYYDMDETDLVALVSTIHDTYIREEFTKRGR